MNGCGFGGCWWIIILILIFCCGCGGSACRTCCKSLKTTIPFIKGHNLDYSRIMGFCGKYKTAAHYASPLFFIYLLFPNAFQGVSQ